MLQHVNGDIYVTENILYEIFFVYYIQHIFLHKSA